MCLWNAPCSACNRHTANALDDDAKLDADILLSVRFKQQVNRLFTTTLH